MPMVVLEREAKDGKEMKRETNAKTPRPGRGQRRAQRSAEITRRRVGRSKHLALSALSTADLVLLSLLAERPMHGYQANLELERREIRGWAILSPPHVYYSLGKIAKRGLLRSSETGQPAGGPERRTF